MRCDCSKPQEPGLSRPEACFRTFDDDDDIIKKIPVDLRDFFSADKIENVSKNWSWLEFLDEATFQFFSLAVLLCIIYFQK